jgi:hypothetical protein
MERKEVKNVLELLYGTQEKRERKENDRAALIKHNICKGKGLNGVY